MKIDYDGPRVTIELERDELDHLSLDVEQMVEWFGSTLRALASLRRGQWNARDWTLTADSPEEMDALRSDPDALARAGAYWVVNDLARLAPRLKGIEAATIREHAARGGSIGHLALAMDTNRATAQSRRNAVLKQEPSTWEQWATGQLRSGPTPPGSSTKRCPLCGDLILKPAYVDHVENCPGSEHGGRSVVNIASGNARVGFQRGVVHGDVHVARSSRTERMTADDEAELDSLDADRQADRDDARIQGLYDPTGEE